MVYTVCLEQVHEMYMRSINMQQFSKTALTKYVNWALSLMRCTNSFNVKHGPSGAALFAGRVQRVTDHLLRHPVVSWVSQAAD